MPAKAYSYMYIAFTYIVLPYFLHSLGNAKPNKTVTLIYTRISQFQLCPSPVGNSGAFSHTVLLSDQTLAFDQIILGHLMILLFSFEFIAL